MLVLVALGTAHAFKFERVVMPPWRGVRQIFAVGPWGRVVDKVSHKMHKLLRKTTNTSHVLFVDSKDGSTRLMHEKHLPPKPLHSARIVAVSDTHGKHRFLPIPDDCDVLVHCGDLLQRYGYVGDLGGGLPVLHDFKRWLEAVPAQHKVFVAGNHDRLLEKLGDEGIRKIFQHDDGQIHYLRDSFVQVNGLTIYGSPWSPEGNTGNRAFQSGRDATEVTQLAIQNAPSIDILMTHAACDKWELMLRSHKVQLWVHGHWHDAYGKTRVHSTSGCISVNVASNDMIYLPKNPPIVMDVCIHQEEI